MKRHTLLATAALTVAAQASVVDARQGPRPTPEVKIARVAAGRLRVLVGVVPQAVDGLPRRPVPYTAEPYAITTVAAKPELREADLLGTGLAIDLDGDGRTTSVLAVACDPQDGSALVGPGRLRVPPLDLALTMRYRRGQRPVTRRLSPRGAEALLYRRCSEQGPATIGLSRPGRRIRARRVLGPALQLIVFEPIDGPAAASRLKVVRLAGAIGGSTHRHRIRVYERLFGDRPGWAAGRMMMVPLHRSKRNPFEITIDGADASRPYLAVAFINWSPGPDQRLRGQPGMARLAAATDGAPAR